MRDGKPGGIKKFANFFGKELENTYKKRLIKTRKTDTLIGILSK